MGVEQLITAPLDFGVGLYEGESKRRQAKRAKRDLLAGIDKAGEQYTGAYDESSAMYDPYVQEGNQARLRREEVFNQLDPNNFRMPEMGNFEYDMDPSKFLDPSMDFQMGEMRDAIQGSAVGSLASGKTLLDLQDRAQGLASTDWNNAMNNTFRDRDFTYGDYLNKFQSDQANINDRYSKLQNQYNRLDNVAQTGMNAVGNQAGMRNQLGQQMGGLEMDRGNVNANSQFQNSMMDDVVGGLGNLSKGLTSGAMGAMGGGMPTSMDQTGIMGMQSFGNNMQNQYQTQKQNPYGLNNYTQNMQNSMWKG